MFEEGTLLLPKLYCIICLDISTNTSSVLWEEVEFGEGAAVCKGWFSRETPCWLLHFRLQRFTLQLSSILSGECLKNNGPADWNSLTRCMCSGETLAAFPRIFRGVCGCDRCKTVTKCDNIVALWSKPDFPQHLPAASSENGENRTDAMASCWWHSLYFRSHIVFIFPLFSPLHFVLQLCANLLQFDFLLSNNLWKFLRRKEQLENKLVYSEFAGFTLIKYTHCSPSLFILPLIEA